MFVLTAFQQNVNSASVDYHEGGFLMNLLDLTHPAGAHMWDFIWKILMMSSSAISLWLGVYTNERHQELLLTGKPPGIIRIISMGVKTVLELLIPVIGTVQSNFVLSLSKLLFSKIPVIDKLFESTKPLSVVLFLIVLNQMVISIALVFKFSKVTWLVIWTEVT